MQGTAHLASCPGSAATRRPAPAARGASAFREKEHGAWSLVLGPLAVGLLVAPSAAGAAAGLPLRGAFRVMPVWAALPGWVRLERMLWCASPLGPSWPGRKIGLLEARLGVVCLEAVATAYRG